MAPMPSSTNGATFVIRLGTSEPKAPTIEAAAEMGDWRACVAVDEDLWLLLLLLPLLDVDDDDVDSEASVIEINNKTKTR